MKTDKEVRKKKLKKGKNSGKNKEEVGRKKW